MWFAVALVIAGALMKAYAQYRQGQAAEAAYESQARLQEQQADVAEYQAREATESGAREERQHRLKVTQIKGAQRATYGASGVEVGSGAPADVVAETAALGDYDALTIRHNAALEAWGYRTKASQLRSSAELSRRIGKEQKRGALWGAGATLLGGIGRSYAYGSM